jgi:hypothetical protein
MEVTTLEVHSRRYEAWRSGRVSTASPRIAPRRLRGRGSGAASAAGISSGVEEGWADVTEGTVRNDIDCRPLRAQCPYSDQITSLRAHPQFTASG